MSAARAGCSKGGASPQHQDPLLKPTDSYATPITGGELPEKNGRRFPDLVFERGGERIAIQIGRVTKKGLPVARERRAMSDLWSTGDFDQVFYVLYVP